MADMYSEDILAEENQCMLCCRRFFASRFQNKSLRSRSAALSEKDVKQINMYSAIRGQWNSRIDFFMCCLGFMIGFGNIWRFPIKVYLGGGGAFLIPYVIVAALIGVPLLLMELSLGQFSGRSPLKAFKFVPILYGIGWCMYLITTLVLIYYSVVMAWCYFYLFGSLNPTMPWTSCNNTFNTKLCLSTDVHMDNINHSIRHVSSTSEYWEYYVSGLVKFPSDIRYTMNEDPGRPLWHITLCLLLVWVVAASILMFGNRVSGKVIYFSVIFPYIAIIALIVLGSTLPGAYDGVMFYLTPKWSKMKNLIVYRDVIEQLFFSIGVGLGPMITFSSYNGIRDNIYRDSVFLITIDFVTSLLSGFAVFEIIGYMSYRHGTPIEYLVSSGSGLFFITYTEALATLSYSNVWTFIFMLMVIAIGMGTQFAMVETIVTGMVDICPMIRGTRRKKGIFVWIVCSVFFLFGILLCTPGGQYYFALLDLRVMSFGLPIVILFETIAIGSIYGIKQFKYDCRMIMGFSLSWYWFIMMAFVSPVIIVVVLIASITQSRRPDVYGETLPFWGEVLAFLFFLLVLSPIIICAILTVLLYQEKYPDLKGKDMIKKLYSSPVYWGPIYLKSWILGEFYREKLLENMKNPELYKYAPDYQHLNAIAQSAKEGI